MPRTSAALLVSNVAATEAAAALCRTLASI